MSRTLRKSDSGVARRITDILTVNDFTEELVTKVLCDKLAIKGYRLGLSVGRLRRYVRLIPQRFYVQLNGSLAEKITSAAVALQSKAIYTGNIEADLEIRLTLTKLIMKRAVVRVVEQLTSGEITTGAG
jgi:hypothetical protein